ncbi:hypothetical protein T01_2685 [Trichinella spiralis]|uniref:Uncharacterized protein n=1 Tax=Trichinella spiralis TaxID=6334 RepID=A0A0V1AVZ2_TRISP|nr:hypothetical protein T01_2685 [Trichinella spiralis]
MTVLSGDTRSASFGLLFRMKTAIKMEPAQFIGLYTGCLNYNAANQLCKSVVTQPRDPPLCLSSIGQRVTKGNPAIMTSS